jgi:L-cysteine:1D-myo-inositol 2-amino-2-deoxy-alpha-D-glucopyranoside ligase
MLKVFDTYSQDLVELSFNDKTVRLYTCGITPYDAAHVGHAKVYLTYDILQRRLIDLGYEPKCVRNITDVDDDILKKARELGVNYLDLAKEEIAKFNNVVNSLNLLHPRSSPRASGVIPEILLLIEKIINAGCGYVSNGHVYFDVTKAAGFGSLSHLSETQMLELARQRGGNPDDPNKKHPLDFVLWQPSLEDEPYWESRWGPGRPGWHIECSALVLKEHAGHTLDIHGGGQDLIFPHHECEKVQAEVVTNKKFCRYWVHVAMVRLNGKKMAKSDGNLVFVDELFKDYEPMAVRVALLLKHYRDSFDFTYSLIQTGQQYLDAFRSAPDGDGRIEKVREFLDNDLDTVSALEMLYEDALAKKPVRKSLELLGINL